MATQSKALSGILVALITPFTEDGKSINEPVFQEHVEHLISAGLHGLVPGGTTAEFTAMTLAERKQATELCVKFAAGRVPVVAGIGSTSTADCLELAAHAAQAGAAALMVVPPFYDAVNYEQLQELLREINQASGGLPVVYYHIPSASGLQLSPKQIADLSDVGVGYLKDTSGNAPAFTELVFGPLSKKITAFNGWDTLTFYSLAAGCKGGVWGAANIFPELAAELWDAVAVRGDLQRGRELWFKLWPICNFLESHNYPSAIKTALELLGYKTGVPRKPFSILKDPHRQELAQLLRDAGLKVVE